MDILFGLIGVIMIVCALIILYNLQEEPKIKIKFFENYVHLCYEKNKKGINKLFLNGKEVKLKKSQSLETWIESENLYKYSEEIK